MIFFKNSEEIRKKLTTNIEELRLKLAEKQEEYKNQAPSEDLKQKNSKLSEKEFFSRIFDPGDEYTQAIKKEIEQIEKQIRRFELILRNIPEDTSKIELTADELEEFGF